MYTAGDLWSAKYEHFRRKIGVFQLRETVVAYVNTVKSIYCALSNAEAGIYIISMGLKMLGKTYRPKRNQVWTSRALRVYAFIMALLCM
jgi:hypothetical protein